MCMNVLYHINTSEIPGELSRKNMISSLMKITCYFTCESITVVMLTCEIFFNTRREIAYLQAAM